MSTYNLRQKLFLQSSLSSPPTWFICWVIQCCRSLWWQQSRTCSYSLCDTSQKQALLQGVILLRVEAKEILIRNPLRSTWMMRCLFSTCNTKPTHPPLLHLNKCFQPIKQFQSGFSVLLSHLLKPCTYKALKCLLFRCMCFFHTTMTGFVLTGVRLSHSSTNSAWSRHVDFIPFYPVF